MLIKSFEGFRPRAVRRHDGSLVIGYGHTSSAREDVHISEEEAELLLLHDLIPIVKYLNDEIRRPLNTHQFDALVSFVFNIGLASFKRTDIPSLLRKGRIEAAAEALSNMPDNTPLPSDIAYRRRSQERALFETPARLHASLDTIIVAPINPPGTLSFPYMEAPLGVTGVVRHDESLLADARSALLANDNDAPASTKGSKKTRHKPQQIGSTLLLAAVGLLVGTAAVGAFRQGISNSVTQQHGAFIGTILCFLGSALIAVAFWAYKHSKPTRELKA